MIADIRREPDGKVFEADICFIGGGAAALAAALRLKSTSLKVLVLESGGRDPDPATKALAAGEQSGIRYFPLEDSRVRMLGGSTYRWGARSAPLKAIDHERRDWVAMSGWPFGPEELAPYHDAVHDLVGLARPFAYDGGVFRLFRTAPPAFDSARLEFSAFQFGKNLIFGDAFAPSLAAAENLAVFLHANVTALELSDDARRIESAVVQTLDGKRFAARASAFVLACGGVDNPRLLLNWNLCNASGLLGRTFMEHPTQTAGVVRSDDWQRLCDVFSPGLVEGRFVEVGLAPSPALQREKNILNAVARIRPIVTADATQALREILWNAKHRKIPLSLQWYKNPWLKERVEAILSDPLSIPLNVVRHLQGKPKRFKADSVVLELRTEQAPNLESRVALAGTADPFGLRRAHLHWAMTPIDKRTMRVTAETVDAELRRLGLGALDLHDWLKTDDLVWSDDIVGGHHHMGTTRMADDPAAGVVDRHGKAHGLDNFYIAGSSVFPTAGFVNPTFTLLCLALRLADHLKERLAARRALSAAKVVKTPLSA
jgi:choline dehydrogenase-like flavoprotein